MIIVTTNELPGYEIEEVFGEVFGLTVRSRNIGSQIGAALKILGGGELKGMTKMLDRRPRACDRTADRGGRGQRRQRDPRLPLRHLGAGRNLDRDLRLRHRRAGAPALARRPSRRRRGPRHATPTISSHESGAGPSPPTPSTGAGSSCSKTATSSTPPSRWPRRRGGRRRRPRSARRSAAPTTGPAASPRRRSSSRRWSRPTTVDDYAHFCLGRALSQTGETSAPATTWRWPRTCARTAATTATTATCSTPERRSEAADQLADGFLGEVGAEGVDLVVELQVAVDAVDFGAVADQPAAAAGARGPVAADRQGRRAGKG